MAPDPVRAALYTRLTGDTTLEGLLVEPGAVFEEGAPQGTAPPYVVFQYHGGAKQWTFGEENERAVWLIQGVCRGGFSTPAEEIDARCEALLHKARLAVPGGTLTILRESPVRYGESPNGEQWRHRGAYYRVFT